MSKEIDQSRSTWSSKWAFILAGAGSAVGLGNMWRFPYLAAKYGGGMFLFTYLILVFTFGVSLLLLETALGRHTRQSVIGAYASFGKKYRFIGYLSMLVPFIITPYYCIIGGWVARYAVGYISDGPDAMADGGTFFSSFITSPIASYLFMAVFMIVVFLVVAGGVKGGIERANKIMMPALIVMAVGIAVYTLSMPGAIQGAAYYIIPDFSKFSPELLIGALGQMFYSLSLAMAIMVTYGSYMPREDSLTNSVASICCFDIGISFIAGLMIVPAAFVALGSGEAVAASSGPSLMFITLPTVFDGMGSVAGILGTLFFVLVLFAALTSAISLTEACVSILQDGLHWFRSRALIVTFVVVFACGIFINAGYNGLSFIEPLGPGSSLLDFFDFISNSVIMPIVALLTCIFVGWIIKPQVLIDEVRISSKFVLAKPWTIMVKFIAPVLVVVILVAYVAQTFGLISF